MTRVKEFNLPDLGEGLTEGLTEGVAVGLGLLCGLPLPCCSPLLPCCSAPDAVASSPVAEGSGLDDSELSSPGCFTVAQNDVMLASPPARPASVLRNPTWSCRPCRTAFDHAVHRPNAAFRSPEGLALGLGLAEVEGLAVGLGDAVGVAVGVAVGDAVGLALDPNW